MNIGDKVRFLNTTGGGIVKGFKGRDIVMVEDEDGFDIPILMRECVVIDTAKEAQVRNQPQQEETIKQVVSDYQSKPTPEYIPEETKEGNRLSVYLAYLPVDYKNLSSSNFECYLINESNYYLSYNYLSNAENGWISRKTGIIEPNTRIFIEEFGHESLNDLERVCLQLFAYKQDKPFDLKNTYSIDIRIDTVKFYKLHSFRENDYFDEEAIVYTLIERDLAGKELKIDAEELALAMQEKLQTERRKQQPVAKKSKNEILEVDLHIHELLDNTAGLEAADILQYQLDKFNEVMQENSRNKGQKIVFIHGKGDGVLKNAILKELKTKYKNMYFQDASFREYGYGATMVTIK